MRLLGLVVLMVLSGVLGGMIVLLGAPLLPTTQPGKATVLAPLVQAVGTAPAPDTFAAPRQILATTAPPASP